MKTSTQFAFFAAGILICLTALLPNSPMLAHLDEAATTQVYLPILFSRLPPTATPTRTPSPTPTKTPTPTPTATPGSASPKPSYPTPAPYGDCLPSDPNYRDKGGNGPYKFCVAEDLHWVNIAHAPSVQHFKAGTDKWMTLQWNVYGINAVRLAADPSSQISNCAAPGKNGFSQPVNGNGNYTFNLKDLGVGQYKFELFITRKDGVIVGHNEVFVCLT